MTGQVRGDWFLGRRIGQIFTAFGVLIAVLIAVLAVAGVRFVDAGNTVVYRWQPARLASEQVLADLVNQETGIRGYAITGDRASLQPYLEYLPQQRRDTQRLRDLVGDDAAVSARLGRFEDRANQWRRAYARPILSRLTSGQPASRIDLDAGKARFDRIRVAAAALDRELDERSTQARHSRVTTGITALVALVIGILLVSLGVLFLLRGLHLWILRPVSRLGGQTRRVAGGELDRAIEPSGPLELVRLGDDVENMRARIVAELATAERVGEDLRRQSEELERSNADLAQFAYVASHDLSEPLRKVSNFCQLIERQYGPQLDDRARQYIFFAVDGAKRMQALINDLLSLSRVGRSTESFVPVDLDAALTQALSTLSERISAAGATIERVDPLPTVFGDKSLLTSLLENLVGNAVKYHRDDVAPVVTLRVQRIDPAAAAARGVPSATGAWDIRVSDNGIGIDEQYAERIFAVFQRLHLRDQYGGTGIGLALCRRIVSFHGGRIELETPSAPGAEGATFLITLPEGNPRAETHR